MIHHSFSIVSFAHCYVWIAPPISICERGSISIIASVTSLLLNQITSFKKESIRETPSKLSLGRRRLEKHISRPVSCTTKTIPDFRLPPPGKIPPDLSPTTTPITMPSKKKIILAKPADWDAWFSFVRARATNSRIWNLIDPGLTEQPVSLVKPIVPQYLMPDNDADFNIDTYNVFKAHKHLYKTDYALFERQQNAFGDIISFFWETIATHNLKFIQSEDPHPWNILRALKRRFAPSDEAHNLQIERKYHKLCKGPDTENLETWLDEWTITFTEPKERAIADLTGTRSVRDFLMAIRSKDPAFADAHLVLLEDKGADDLYQLIEKFRQHIRLQRLQHPSKRKSHSAFAAGTNSNNASFQGQQKPPKPCICGGTHWVADCYYLVPENRPTGWNPNSKKQRKVDEALKSNQTKILVKKMLQKHKNRDSKSSGGASLANTPTNASTNSSPGTSTPAKGVGELTAQTAFAAPTYHLQSSWILSVDSNTHVCNSTMLSRFNMTHVSEPNDRLMACNVTQAGMPIECYGTIQITIRTPTGPQKITLLNVAYVPNFMTNIVSEYKLSVKGLYFDSWKMHLHRDGKTFGFVERYNGRCLLENNLSATTKAVSKQD